LKNLIKKALALLSIKVTVENKKHELLKLGISTDNADILEDDNIRLKDFGFIVNHKTQRFIIDGVRIMYDLKNKCGAQFFLADNGDLTVHIEDLNCQIQTYEEFFILNELFVNGVYNIQINGDFHLIDIGMNVGFTSLYFAQQPNCVSVNGYEPFKPTYLQALNNIALNERLKHKINAHNYGLGNADETITVTYDPGLKGNMGINGIPDYLAGQSHNRISEQISIKNSSETLLPLIYAIKEHGDSIVLKMDCEGSEYNIFKSFSATGILQHFSVIMMEWHVKGPDEITALLKEHGYQYVSFSPKDQGTGMIYAFKI